MVIISPLVVHSWYFNIADKMPVSIGESHFMGMVTALCVDSINHKIGHGNDIPTATKYFSAAVQSHKLESALKIADGSKRNRSLGPSDLTVTRVVFLVHLAILSELETQMFLVV
jgi:hypothetical protein